MKLLQVGAQWINVGIVRLFRETRDVGPRIEIIYEDDATLALEGEDAIALRAFLVLNSRSVAPGPAPTEFAGSGGLPGNPGDEGGLPPEIYRGEQAGS